MDTGGNLYVAERVAVRKIAPSNLITLVAGTGVLGYSGDHGLATTALVNLPAGMAFDGKGNLYIADSGNHVVREVTPDGIITTIAGTGKAGSAGDGGQAQDAQLNSPQGVAVNSREISMSPNIPGRGYEKSARMGPSSRSPGPVYRDSAEITGRRR